MAAGGKTALVTGANGHIGNNLVKALLARGYRVHTSVRDAGDPKKTETLPKSDIVLTSLDVRDAEQLGAHYDTLLARWLGVPDPERPDPNPDINLIGLGLGAHLVGRTGLDWAVVSDGSASEIALYGQLGDIMIYPTNAVAKRWVAHEMGFLPNFSERTIQTVAHIQTAHRPGS